MDSITQAVLGAAIGEAVLGKKHGRKGAAWGAVCATLPDLDTLYPFAGVVESFTWHRGYSHALPVLILIAPLFAYTLAHIHRVRGREARRWFWVVLLVLVTHSLLDCMTVYGTQVLLPFSDYPAAASVIFIIDPFYTVPLLTGVLCALCMRHDYVREVNDARSVNGDATSSASVTSVANVASAASLSSLCIGRRLNLAGLVLSTLYLCLAVMVKAHVNHVTERTLANNGLDNAQYLTAPTAFNIILWRIVVREPGAYYEGFYSLLDKDDAVKLTRRPSEDELLATLADSPQIKRLQHFSRGFYKISHDDKYLVLTDLRIGLREWFVFSFTIAVHDDGVYKPLPSADIKQFERESGGVESVRWVWRRIFSSSG